MANVLTTDDALAGQRLTLLTAGREPVRVSVEDSGGGGGEGTVTELTGTQVWTVEGDIPAGDRLVCTLDGPGGGGASGMNLAANSLGGSAGGAGARTPPTEYTRTFLVSQLPITITLPLGGLGGVAVAGSINAAGVDAAQPVSGASFGDLLFAGAGASANGATTASTTRAGGGGGGAHGDAPLPVSGLDSTGGPPDPGGNPFDTFDATYGGAGNDRGFSVEGNSVWGGGAGGTSGDQTGVPQVNGIDGGSSSYGSGGGGGGGSVNSGGTNTGTGADGGKSGPQGTSGIKAGGGAAGGAVASDGTAGTASNRFQGATAGGGGGAAHQTNDGNTAGNGADGGEGGGGGGGGGGMRRVSGTVTPGSGGNGGAAKLTIVAF